MYFITDKLLKVNLESCQERIHLPLYVSTPLRTKCCISTPVIDRQDQINQQSVDLVGQNSEVHLEQSQI